MFKAMDFTDFKDFQVFQAPEPGLYNITVAGAPGGRGLCNILYGRGITVSVQVELTSEIDLLILVGQSGEDPCSLDSDFFLCEEPPKTFQNATDCKTRWLQHLESLTIPELFGVTGGGGGGGASMIRVLRGSDGVVTFPLIVAGGGGGTGATLVEYDQIFHRTSSNMTDEELYQAYTDGKEADRNSSVGSRGFTDISDPEQLRAGVGGGYIHLPNPLAVERRVDGGNLFVNPIGGEECSPTLMLFTRAVGGYGGGGGGCGGGGGGGGFTGGAILGSSNTIPGSGGTSYLGTFSPRPNLLQYTINDKLYGYVDIVPADCGCVYECAVHEEKNQFECLCPNNTQLAPDLSDCYYSE